MNDDKVRLAIRGFANGVLAFAEYVDCSEDDLQALGETHAKRLVGQPHMIEIEFLDEPDLTQRFFRFGTDPRGMVRPLKVDLSNP